MTKIFILSTSDVHGYIAPSDFVHKSEQDFGLAKAQSLIKDFKKKHQNDIVLTIENGDFIQGSPLADFIARKDPHFSFLFEKTANEIGYDVRVLGNHEFNYGLKYLKKAIPETSSVINANIVSSKGDFYDKPFAIFDFQNVKIAVIGLTTKYVPHWEDSKNIDHLSFLDPVKKAKQLVPILKKKGADLIFVAYHGGFERSPLSDEPTEKITGENQGWELLKKVPGIDALVTGHQHRLLSGLSNGINGQIPFTQPGQRGQAVGLIEIDYDTDNKKILDKSARLLFTKKYTPDQKIMDLILPLQNKLDLYLDQTIGISEPDLLVKDHFKARLYGHPYLDFVNKVQSSAVGADISATALFSNKVLGLPHEITRRDVVTNYLFPNTAVSEAITGRQLLAALERAAEYFSLDDKGDVIVSKDFSGKNVEHFNYDYFSGIDYTFDLKKSVGKRVENVTYNGQPIDPDKKYLVAISNYRSSGTGGYEKSYSADKIVNSSADTMTDLIIDYIKKNSPIRAKKINNLHIIS
ncbi:bifunctional metallophosphatase/5'-nucleotidase [Oenococcus alcoholitolerans]|uniref:bifunctional metallophosphatase/5'-nucleotidase n=1 Tax=Oenococcus alcoholitolerans TaxID=931074 RepID=UPI003F71B098